MFNAQFKKVCLGTVVATAALLGSAGTAQAAVYTGVWDPAFGGSIFPNLGWRGSATFVLPDGCVGLTGSFANTASPCGGGGMQVLDAKVDLYDIGAPGTVLETLNFGTTPVIGMQIVTSGDVTALTGTDTEFFSKVLASTSVAQYNGASYNWQLGLLGNKAALFYTRPSSLSGLCATGAFGLIGNDQCGYSATPATIVFSPAIPEPSTYALLLAGLAGVWAMRRRTVATATAAR